jgi:non-specific serine/threonine protein kinase
LRVLATSRESLEIGGEVVWHVSALSLPHSGASTDLDEVGDSEAVRLFVERTRAAQKSFALTAQNVHAVAEICLRLDGIPLALELAAARVSVLGVDQLAARVGDSLHLLTTGRRTAPGRQQTLRAVVDWSYGLLTDTERVLFARLSVFAGGWTLDSAEAVCAACSIASDDVLNLIGRLVDKSLVVADDRPGGVLRYRLLDTLRHYAGERLTVRGAADAARRRHVDYFMALAQRAGPHLRADAAGDDAAEWLVVLERELDNLRAVMRWLLDQREARMGLQLAQALWGFWLSRGYLSEGQAFFEAVLALETADVPGERLPFLEAAGMLALARHDFRLAVGHYTESLMLYRQTGDLHGVAKAMNSLGNIALQQRDLPAARSRYRESLAIRRRIGDRVGVAHSLHNLGVMARYSRDWRRAIVLGEASLRLDRELDRKLDTAVGLTGLGLAVLDGGDYARALIVLREGLVLVWETASRWHIPECLDALAAVAAASRQPHRAARLLGAADGLRALIGGSLAPSEPEARDRAVLGARTQIGHEGFEAAYASGQVMSLEHVVAYALADEPSD